MKQDIRARCVERDGYCRLGSRFGRCRDRYAVGLDISCDGPSEWAHLKGHRRSQTRGMAPERRHTTTHSLMLCQKHHGLEERGTLRIEYLTDQGCDGPIRFIRR